MSRNQTRPETGASRRTFLKQATAAAATTPLWFPTVLTSAWGRTTIPSNRVTMGLIGCGGMGMANLNSFLSQDDVQVVAVCDPDESRREAAKARVEAHYSSKKQGAAFRGCATFRDYRDMLTRPDIHAVVQATPDHWHAKIIVDAATAGKDIYGEKPLSLTIKQGREMERAVARYGRVFQTGSQQRSDARFRHACELIRNGRIGRVHTVTCGLPKSPTTGNHPPIPVPDGFDYDLWLGPAPWAPYCENRTHWNFRWISDYSGGQVTDWGAHHIDIAHWGLDLARTGPTKVEPLFANYPSDGLWDVASNYHFVATYASGVKINVTSEVPNGVKWEGDDGWVFVTRGAIDASDKTLLNEQFGPNEIHLPRSPGHHRNFLDCCKNRHHTIAPIEEAHRTVSVSHLGNIAMKLGRAINWDPASESVQGDATASRMTDRACREPYRF